MTTVAIPRELEAAIVRTKSDLSSPSARERSAHFSAARGSDGAFHRWPSGCYYAE